MPHPVSLIVTVTQSPSWRLRTVMVCQILQAPQQSWIKPLFENTATQETQVIYLAQQNLLNHQAKLIELDSDLLGEYECHCPSKLAAKTAQSAQCQPTPAAISVCTELSKCKAMARSAAFAS
jgi:hypothetical protein